MAATVGGLAYPTYNLLLIALALVSGWDSWFLRARRQAAACRDHDPEISRAMGINVNRYYLVTFTFGSLLARSPAPSWRRRSRWCRASASKSSCLSFAVVVIGGLGSLPGAALGALIVGLVRSISVHYMPEVELFVIYFVMVVVLFRPRGLFSLAEPRKI